MNSSKMLSVAKVMAALCVAFLMTSCSAGEQSRNSDNVVSQPTDIDPQILNDVVAMFTPLPDDSVLRGMRVSRALNWLVPEKCGGAADTEPDSTSARIDQSMYANLALIAEKSFVEDITNEKPPSADKACESSLQESFPEKSGIMDDWHYRTVDAKASDAVRATEPKVARCLSEKSGLEVDASFPTKDYLLQVSGEVYKASSWEAGKEVREELSKIFVECTPDFFEEMKRQLEPQRKEIIERHREALEEFAVRLTDIGYTP